MAFVLPNLDFEYELRGLGPGRRRKALDRQLERQTQRWSHVLRLEPGFAQAQVLPWPPTPGAPLFAAPLLAWGVSPILVGLLDPAAAAALPDASAVRRANAKGTSHELERALGTALPHACRVASLEELERAIAACPYPWVAKHPFGVSGRERLLGRAGELDDPGRRWAQRVLSQEELVFEPWVEKSAEWSVQFDLAPGGEATLLGTCRLHTGARGQFAGHSVGGPPAPASIVDPARKGVEAIGRLGYHGPVGVDAFEGALGGRPVIRAICEINARVSFGRLALHLADHVPAARFTWHHPPASEGAEVPARSALEARGPGRYRLPDFADPQGASGTCVLVEA